MIYNYNKSICQTKIAILSTNKHKTLTRTENTKFNTWLYMLSKTSQESWFYFENTMYQKYVDVKRWYAAVIKTKHCSPPNGKSSVYIAIPLVKTTLPQSQIKSDPKIDTDVILNQVIPSGKLLQYRV